MMKTKFLIYPLLLAMFCLFGVSNSLEAADSKTPFAGYVYVAPGERTGLGPVDFNLTVGGGVDVLLIDGFGASADIGYLFLNEKKDFGIFAPGIFYQFQHSSKLVPYLEGGYALGFNSDTFNMGYFGGGVNYWVNDRIGVKVGIRDHVGTNNPTLFNITEFKLGLTFR